MSVIEWDDSLSVNIAELDRQHQELVKLFNHLADAIREKRGNEAFGRILDGLIIFAEQHFQAEEGYLVQYGYPEAESHKEEHMTFVLRILEYQETLKNEKVFMAADILLFLWDWFKYHIKEKDRGYSLFLQENGLR